MTDFTAWGVGASGVAIQADGRIVVVGMAGNGWDAKFALARYNSDGTLDATFGVDGKVMTDFTSWDGMQPSGVAIQADGKIVAAGVAAASAASRPESPTASSPSPATTATAPSTRPSASTAR